NRGELQPIRLTFRSRGPVYPLRISSLNGGETELLVYLLADRALAADGFTVEFSRELSAEVLNGITKNTPEIHGPMHLTKMVRKMRTASMTQDVYFSVPVRLQR